MSLEPNENISPKDVLLTFLLKARGFIGDARISKDLNIPQEEILRLIDEIKRSKPGLIKTQRGYGDDHIWACVSSHAEVEVRLFLSNGGFTKEEKLHQAKARLEEEKASKEYEKLHLEIENLRNQVFDYERVKSQSKWALILAGISTAAAVIALLK